MSLLGPPEATDPRIGAQRAWWDYTAILVSQVLFMALALAGVSLATRLLGPEGYGTVALVVSAVQIFSVVGLGWIMPATIRFGREALVQEGAAGRFFWSWLPLGVGSALISVLVAVASMPLIHRYSGLSRGLAALFLFLLLATAIARAVDSLLQMAGRMRVYAVGLPTGKLVYVLALGGVPLLTGWEINAGGVVLLMGLALAVQVVVGFLFLESRLFRPVTIDWALTRRMATYSSPLLLSFSAGYLSDWMDISLLRAFRTTAEVGIYHVAYQAMLLVSGILTGVTTLAFPLLTTWRAEGSDQQVRRYLNRLVPQAAVCWGLFISGVGLVGGFLFPLLFGPSFQEGSRYFCLLLAGTAFQIVSYFYSPIFSSYDILGHATRILFAMAVVNFFIDLLLIPSWGPTGAAVATAASYASGAFLYLMFGNRRLGVQRTAALVPPCLAVVPLLAFAAGLGLVPEFVLFLLSGGAILGWAKRQQVFNRADLIMFERIRLPKTIRTGMTKTYEVLS